MGIRFLVSADRINKVLSPPEYFGLGEGHLSDQYKIMLKFMVDEAGNYLTADEAEAQMRSINMEVFFIESLPAFVQSMKDAFVSPTSAGG
jgi:hypothetical protein